MRSVLVAALVVCSLTLSVLAAPGARAGPGYGWPTPGRPQLVRAFDPPAQRWLAGHRGVDLRADPGQPVLSPADGTVTFSGTVVDRQVVTVQDAAGLKHSFEPVTEPLPAGSVVRRGDRLALVAPGHCSVGCVHWGVRENRSYLDPVRLLPRPRAVLLPTGRLTAAGSHLASPAGSPAHPRSRSPPGRGPRSPSDAHAAGPPSPGRRCSSW